MLDIVRCKQINWIEWNEMKWNESFGCLMHSKWDQKNYKKIKNTSILQKTPLKNKNNTSRCFFLSFFLSFFFLSFFLPFFYCFYFLFCFFSEWERYRILMKTICSPTKPTHKPTHHILYNFSQTAFLDKNKILR